MTYSLTVVAYSCALVSLLYFTYRLFQYWKADKNYITKLWLWIIITFDIVPLISISSKLFFYKTINFVAYVSSFEAIFQGLALSLMVYLFFIIKFQKISPLWGFIPVFILGTTAAFLTAFVPFDPILTEMGAINMNPSVTTVTIIVAIIRAFIFSIATIPLIIVLFQQFKNSKDRMAKNKSLGLAIMFLLMLITAVVDFILSTVFKAPSFIRDILLITASIVLFVSLVITQRPVSSSAASQ